MLLVACWQLMDFIRISLQEANMHSSCTLERLSHVQRLECAQQGQGVASMHRELAVTSCMPCNTVATQLSQQQSVITHDTCLHQCEVQSPTCLLAQCDAMPQLQQTAVCSRDHDCFVQLLGVHITDPACLLICFQCSKLLVRLSIKAAIPYMLLHCSNFYYTHT